MGSVAVKRRHDHGNSYKRKHLTGVGLQFRGLTHCYSKKKNGGTQADMVLEKELRLLHPDKQTAGKENGIVS